MKRFLKGEKSAVDEMTRLGEIGVSDGGTLAPDLAGTPKPFKGMNPREARRRIEAAKRSKAFTDQLLSCRPEAKMRMDRLFATAFPETGKGNDDDDPFGKSSGFG